MNNYSKSDINKLVEQSIQMLLKYDRYLLDHNLREESISHMLAMYLKSLFQDWDVDCEYDKDHDITKTLQLPRRQRNKSLPDDEIKDRVVLPDIIVHHRSTNCNLLAIELKKFDSPDGFEFDILKLHGFKKELGYQYAMLIIIHTGDDDSGCYKINLI